MITPDYGSGYLGFNVGQFLTDQRNRAAGRARKGGAVGFFAAAANTLTGLNNSGEGGHASGRGQASPAEINTLYTALAVAGAAVLVVMAMRRL